MQYGSSNKRFEIRDLYRIPVWVLAKPLYSFAAPSLLFRLASARGRLDSWFLPLRREIRQQIARQLGEQSGSSEVRLIALRHLQARRKSIYARIWPQVRDFADADAVRVEGLEHLDHALSCGKGAILASAHFGYPRLIKPVLRSRGRAALLVGPPARESGPQLFPPYFTRVGALVHDRILRLPRASSLDPRWQQTVGTDLVAGLNLRPHLDALARNEILIVLADGQAGHMFKMARVLGVDVPFAPGVIRLARRSGAAVLPTFVVDDPDDHGPGGMRVIIRPKLEVHPNGDADADLSLERFAAVYREVAQAFPHDWHWSMVWDGKLAPVTDLGTTLPKFVDPGMFFRRREAPGQSES